MRNRSRAVVRSKFGKNIAHMAFDGINCYDELLSNLLVGGTLRKQVQHLQFTCTQGVEQRLPG